MAKTKAKAWCERAQAVAANQPTIRLDIAQWAVSLEATGGVLVRTQNSYLHLEKSEMDRLAQWWMAQQEPETKE